MKKFFLLLSVLALFSQNIDAKSITPEQAIAIAQQQFVSQTKFNASPAKMTLSRQAMNLKGQTDYYVFNRDGGQGFVIVSGDDVVSPILGYSERARLITIRLPSTCSTCLMSISTRSSICARILKKLLR